jgi:hypothetical protein
MRLFRSPGNRRESNIKRKLRKRVLIAGFVLGLCGSEQGSVAGFCKYGDEPSDSIKGREFLDQLRSLVGPQEVPYLLELVE